MPLEYDHPLHRDAEIHAAEALQAGPRIKAAARDGLEGGEENGEVKLHAYADKTLTLNHPQPFRKKALKSPQS